MRVHSLYKYAQDVALDEAAVAVPKARRPILMGAVEGKNAFRFGAASIAKKRGMLPSTGLAHKLAMPIIMKEAAEAAGDYTWKEKVKGAQRALRERNGAPARWYQSGDAQKEYSKTMHEAQLRGAGIGAGLGAIGGAAYGALSKDKAGGRAINTVIPALLGAASGSVIGTTAGTMRAAKPAYERMSQALKQKGLENKGKWRADWHYTPEAEAKYLAPYRK